MDSELMRYANGEAKPRRQRRAVAARAGDFYDDVQMANFEWQGVRALTAEVMEGMADLNALRKRLAKDDPALNTLLAQFQLDAAEQARDVIRDVRPKWLSW